MLSNILKSDDTIGILGTTSTSNTLPITGFGFIVLLISTGIACWLTLSNKVIYEIVMN